MYGWLLIFYWVYVSADSYEVKLKKRSTLYLPYDYSGGTRMYGFGRYPVEQLSYDHENQIVYTAGSALLHAIDVSDPDKMEILTHLEYPGMEFTDVEYCGGYIFTALDNRTDRDNGKVIVFSQSMAELIQIPVGAIPDMIKHTSDCTTLVVAVEGEGYEYPPNQVTDPPGLVVIISFPSGVSNNYNIVSLDFTYYDDKVGELSKTGVRHVYQVDNNPFSNDVEPEYIAISSDDTLAYIVLQENNAVAVVDLQQKRIKDIHGLGFKNWSQYTLDASDRDNGAMMYPYSVLGMYLPDAIVHFTFEGENYILMANEGGSKNYYFGTYEWSEEMRIGRLNSSIVPNLDLETADQVTRDSLLGRLKVSISPAGMDDSGRLKALYTFGGRGFSIRRADNLSLVYDSGDSVTKTIFVHKNNLYNSEMGDIDNRPFEDYDHRSDNKGAETETLAVGVVDGVTLLFVCNERPGTILVYSIHNNIMGPVFQDIYDGIPEKRTKSWGQMYDERIVSEVDPEDVHFVPASQSPTGRPILLAVGAMSGTVSIIDVEIWQTGSLDSVASLKSSGTGSLLFMVVVVVASVRRYG